MSYERKYKCPYCNKSFPRKKLSTHIDNNHEEMLNEDKGFTANRVVFDVCNNKEPIGNGSGVCRICKNPTKWNEDICRYEAYCSKSCKEQARENYKNNMLKVYGKTTLLDDMEWQETKMLSNRGISGKYKWSDGTYKSYVGSYEKKFLEFCDNVLNIRSDDLLTPGPTIEYDYDGQKHTWITDAIYLPYNLVFDIKDGGNNKNKREMPEYRAKQIEKESFITKQGKYNYIRLTNNEFVQLLTIFAELKELYLEDDNPKTISRIHEHMGGAAIGGLPPCGATDMNPHVFIINYMNKDTMEKDTVLSNDITSDFVIKRNKDNGTLEKVSFDSIFDEYTVCDIYKYKEDPSYILREVYNKYKSKSYVERDYFIHLMTEFTDVLSDDQLEYSELLESVNIEKINEQYHSNISSLQWQLELALHKKINVFPVLDPTKYEYKKVLLKEYSDITVLQDIKGKYFAINNSNMRRTRSVDSIYDINETMLDTISLTY